MSNIPTSTTPGTPGAPGAPDPHKAPTDAEEIYYEGSPPLRGLGFKLLLWPLAGFILIVLPYFLHSSWKPAAIAIFVGLCLPLAPVLWAKTTRYRITNYRIDFERGLISKDIDTMELWHVEDLHFHQSLWDRIMGVGTIRVISRDETMPLLILKGVPNPRPLYETLKQRVIAVKRQRGVIKMDPG
jgi:hypothetical protein